LQFAALPAPGVVSTRKKKAGSGVSAHRVGVRMIKKKKKQKPFVPVRFDRKCGQLPHLSSR
jgi:hypothetical protein